MKILWIDDDWKTIENKNTASPGLLLKVQSEIQSLANKNGISIEWELIHDSTFAFKAIDQKPEKYSFAIVDMVFKEQNTHGLELIPKLEQKGIYYAVFSGIDERTFGESCIGVYGKTKDLNRFPHELMTFLSHPPIRIVQISDLHYDHTVNSDDKTNLLDSIKCVLTDINDERKISVMAIAGDIANKNPVQDLLHVDEEFFNEILRKTLKIEEDRIFIVPGNHEVIWDSFEEKVRSHSPYSTYANMCNQCFSKRILSTYNTKLSRGKLSLNVTENDLSWCRSLKPRLSIIGLCSNATSTNEQGMGRITDEGIKFLHKNWNGSKGENELRILLLHHNFFQIQSSNSKDENRTLVNAGNVLNKLVQSKCDIVLSGHVHRPEVVIYESASSGSDGFLKNRSILFSSTGTVGGMPSTGDFARSFNVLDITRSLDDKMWCIAITPYHYDSRIPKWERRNAVKYKI